MGCPAGPREVGSAATVTVTSTCRAASLQLCGTSPACTDAALRPRLLPLQGPGCCACSYTYFPKLRATADLLMMPKEVLTDGAIRSEVVPGLSLHRICQILERFQPDDFAADPLPKGEPFETAPPKCWAAPAKKVGVLQPEVGAGTASSGPGSSSQELGLALVPARDCGWPWLLCCWASTWAAFWHVVCGSTS